MFVDHFSVFNKFQKEFLEIDDQCEFLRLSTFFKYSSDKNKRNMALSTFGKHLSFIRSFVMQGDTSDFDRGLACGILFYGNLMIVNTKRLKEFLGKSKSCLNGCFHKLGYNVSRIANEDNPQLTEICRHFGRTLPQHRQWCIRSIEPIPSISETMSGDEIEIEPLEFMTDIRSLLNRKSSSI